MGVVVEPRLSDIVTEAALKLGATVVARESKQKIL